MLTTATSWRPTALVGALILAVGPCVEPVFASDPPHWSSSTVTVDCTTPCHVGHHAAGGNLTQAAGNVNLCRSCHNPSGSAGAMPLDAVHSAVPGVRGTSHAADVAAVNAVLATQVPLDPEMAVRVMGGSVVCSTCHDQHAGAAAMGGTPRVRPAAPTTALGSTGSVVSGGTFTGANGVWYLVEVVQAGDPRTARFCYSKDNGISWFPAGCDPPSGVFTPSLAGGGGVPVPLDSGVEVALSTGVFVQGERWEFAAAWPFLRAALADGAGDGSAMCRDCHRAWDMDHVAVENGDGSYKSHPVGVTLNANGRGYDRSTPLDGNGEVQGGASADANPTNDLELDGNGKVQCLSCHGVHFVDSNTLTEDGP